VLPTPFVHSLQRFPNVKSARAVDARKPRELAIELLEHIAAERILVSLGNSRAGHVHPFRNAHAVIEQSDFGDW
jgi:hypothetical protein